MTDREMDTFMSSLAGIYASMTADEYDELVSQAVRVCAGSEDALRGHRLTMELHRRIAEELDRGQFADLDALRRAVNLDRTTRK